MSKIQDNLHNFSFGLWTECPEHAPVAWGARGIADQGVGFSLMLDRQTMVGLEQLRGPFSAMVLNQGALHRANEECRRLRHGWDPLKALLEAAPSKDSNEFFRYVRKRKEYISEHIHGDVASWLLEKLWYYKPNSGPDKQEIYDLLADPRKLRSRLMHEQKILDAYYDAVDRQDAEWERNPPAPPHPPKHCENDEYYADEYDEDVEPDDCPQDFVKVNGKFEGCTWDADSEAWICDLCGYEHYFESEDHPDRVKRPQTPMLEVFRYFFDGGQKMFNDRAETFMLFDDHHLKILGNTNASYGYVYLVAYPHHEVVDLENVKWSGSKAPPNPGDTIRTKELGECIVFGHIVFHDWLHINVLPTSPPDWYLENVKKSGQSMLTNVAGIDIE